MPSTNDDLQRLIEQRIAIGVPSGSPPKPLATVTSLKDADVALSPQLSHELAEVNRRWSIGATPATGSGRRWAVYTVKRLIKKAISWYVDAMFQMQRDYNAAATRLFNASTAALRSHHQRLLSQERQHALDIASLTAKWEELEHAVQALRNETARTTEDMRSDVDRALGETAATIKALDQWSPDWLLRHPKMFNYKAFQDRFRGSEQEIADRQDAYLQEVSAVDGPVVDLGCGRGEFLRLCHGRGLTTIGVDIDEVEVTRLREEGFEAHLADALEFLLGAEDNAFSAIVLLQLVEHLPVGRTLRIIREARRVLKPNGRLIIETINPSSLFVFTHSLFVDPTHLRPVHPLMLQFVLEAEGFTNVQLRFLSPVPESEKLQARDVGMADMRNMGLLNEHLFGPQDYSVLGQKASS